MQGRPTAARGLLVGLVFVVAEKGHFPQGLEADAQAMLPVIALALRAARTIKKEVRWGGHQGGRRSAKRSAEAHLLKGRHNVAR